MKQVPDSLLAFQHMFPDDDACAAWLIEMRWPDGFVCPACGHEKGWALRGKAHTFECAGCRRQTSVTAGTILHASKLPLTVWFWAAYLMATHSSQRHLCPAAPETARYRLLPQRLAARPQAARQHGRPRAQPVVGPGGNRRGQPSIPDQRRSSHRRARTQPRRQDAHRRRHRTRGHGNIPGRLRLAEISSYGAADLGHFVETAADPDAIAKTDGWSGYAAVPADRHNVHVVGKTAAHLVLPRWIHQVFSNLKGWARGVYHGLLCVASICRPISMSSSFASTAAKPATLLSARSSASASRHQCRTPYLQHVDRTGAMCISGIFFTSLASWLTKNTSLSRTTSS